MNQRDPKELTDEQLLDLFDRGRDQVAFAELVRRHAGMVLATSRRLLKRHDDADDACQATFFALAKSIGKLRQKAALPGWLHKTARRCAMDIARSNLRWERNSEKTRPQTRDGATTMIAHCDDPSLNATRAELGQILDEELAKLPAQLRASAVLCDLEGHSQRQAAKQLGVSVATVGNHLTKARQILRSRLARRGISLSVAGLAGWAATSQSASAALTDSFILDLAAKSTLFAAGRSAAEIGVSNSVTGVANNFLWSAVKLKLAASALLTLAAVVIPMTFKMVVVPALRPTPAMTLHYWRFEDEPGFLADSAGTATLSARNIQQVLLPSDARGENFPTALDGVGFNGSAADSKRVIATLTTPDSIPVDSDFTIELFAHMDNLSPLRWEENRRGGMAILAAQATDCTTVDRFSWALGVTRASYNGAVPRELFLNVSTGTEITTFGSGILLDEHQDYFVSAAFELDGVVRFHVKHMSTGRKETIVLQHSLRRINGEPFAMIGGNPHEWGFVDGVIDEVRLSHGVVAIGDLLVNCSAEVQTARRRQAGGSVVAMIPQPLIRKSVRPFAGKP